jgi:hypothetical protein
MMFCYRFVRMIEAHADALAAGLEKRVMSSPSLASFGKIPSEELRERVYEIYRHLGDWLLGKNQSEIEQRYRDIGARRARQKVPLAEVIQVIVFTKENLWEFLKSEVVADQAIELLGELELLQLLEQFFDRAIYAAAVGYQDQMEHFAAQPSEARAS